MEVVEDPPRNTSIDNINNTTECKENSKYSTALIETDMCQKSNGDADLGNIEHSEIVIPEEANIENAVSEVENVESEKNGQDTLNQNDALLGLMPITEVATAQDEVGKKCVSQESITEKRASEHSNLQDTYMEIDLQTGKLNTTTEDQPDSSSEKVTFETEILVETNDNEVLENEIKIENNSAPNLLSELGHSIELSEALCASDVTDNTIENNNCSVGPQEMFNKEELLDILEGNDASDTQFIAVVTNDNESTTIICPTDSKMREAQIAIDQLNRLKSARKSRKRRNSKKLIKDITTEKAVEPKEVPLTEKAQVGEKATMVDEITVADDVPVGEEVTVSEEVTVTELAKEDSIVSNLVKDWEDEEHIDEERRGEPTDNQTKQSVSLAEANNDSVKLLENTKPDCNNLQESTPNDQPGLNKSGDESQRQRRLGRVIKKKVIFDPDNPDTFTKTKVVKPKENLAEKEQPPLKKCKVETFPQNIDRSKSKSPISKLQWKKPTPKSSAKYKRPSEIDKLLMDEGALNMIYQLTPEAPKGKKNMRTKAEFIKKIQSSTPESKEMKFRERKKESKYEEGEAKKILGGKQRTSLSGSVKSPSVSEDFEAHSADDSIIYRRHSSSSYSSSCMSPRRLSDVESAVGPTNIRPSLQNSISENEHMNNTEVSNDSSGGNTLFVGDNASPISTEIINKDDCLSIKKKLNSKLALALNKRKRESGKPDKPLKHKKILKTEVTSPKAPQNPIKENKEYKHLSVNITNRLGEIFIRKSGSKYNLEVIHELIRAMEFMESREDISVTLLTSECGTMCSGLELTPLLDESNETKTKFAQDMAESVRLLLCSVEQHSKLLCTGVEGDCYGVGLALVALSDVSVASERAAFQLARGEFGTGFGSLPLEPGSAVFIAHYRPWSRALLNDLMIFGRQLSAIEALQSGLVSRTIWPERYLEQTRAICTDIASQPLQSVLFRKKLLKINSGPQSTFLSCLEKERDLLVQYWLSAEAQLLRDQFANS